MCHFPLGQRVHTGEGTVIIGTLHLGLQPLTFDTAEANWTSRQISLAGWSTRLSPIFLYVFVCPFPRNACATPPQI